MLPDIYSGMYFLLEMRLNLNHVLRVKLYVYPFLSVWPVLRVIQRPKSPQLALRAFLRCLVAGGV